MPRGLSSPTKKVISNSAASPSGSKLEKIKALSPEASPETSVASGSEDDSEDVSEDEVNSRDGEDESKSEGASSGRSDEEAVGDDSTTIKDAPAAADEEQDEKKGATIAEDGKKVTFEDLGVIPQIVEACTNMGFGFGRGLVLAMADRHCASKLLRRLCTLARTITKLAMLRASMSKLLELLYVDVEILVCCCGEFPLLMSNDPRDDG